MLFVTLFSVSNIVGVREWPISIRAVCLDVAFWQFSNIPPNYSYVADPIKFLILLHSTYTVLFSGGLYCIGALDFGPRKKYPSALLCASGLEM